jgi:hypothetical protein
MNVQTLSTEELISLRDKFKKQLAEKIASEERREVFNNMMNLDFEIFERAVNHKKPHTN